MKILFLNLEYPPIGQGAAAHHEQLIKALVAQYGVTGTLLTSSSDDYDHVGECAPGVKAVKLAVGKKEPHYWTPREVATYMARAAVYLELLLKKEHFDLIHSFFGFPCGFLAWRWRHKIPYILFLMGVDVPGPGTRLSKLQPLLLPMYKKVWGGAAALVANSDDLKNLALKSFPAMDITTIYNGVNTRIFKPSRELPEGLRFLTVARLIPLKNIHIMILAMKEVVKSHKEALLTIVGEGPERANLEKLVKDNHLENNVKFMGYQSRAAMPEIYRAANTFLLISEREGMSNGLLEAMASGLPVLVSDVGGARQLVNGNGRILAEVTPESVAEALLDFHRLRASLLAMGHKSRQVALANSSQKAASKVMALSQKIITDSRS